LCRVLAMPETDCSAHDKYEIKLRKILLLTRAKRAETGVYAFNAANIQNADDGYKTNIRVFS